MNWFTAMAPLLDYPGTDFLDELAQCVASSSGQIHTLLRALQIQVEQLGIGRLQEIYIDTFDFHAETSLYIGHHLFGEEIRRSLFMAELRGRYRACGVVESSELPDHLANILRFLSAAEAGEERSELIHACLVPALRHLLPALRPGNPYTPLLQAILLVLQQEKLASAGVVA